MAAGVHRFGKDGDQCYRTSADVGGEVARVRCNPHASAQTAGWRRARRLTVRRLV